MKIEHYPEQQLFVYLNEVGQQAGRLRYRFISADKIDVFSTVVEPAFQGKGIAGELYLAMITFVQQHQLRVKPSCSYIEKRIERSHPNLIA